MNKLRNTLFDSAQSLFATGALVLVAILMFLPEPVLSDAQEPQLEELKISLSLDKTPLQRVAEDIQKQTGFTLLFSESLVSLPVSGNYQDVSVDEFFRRVLKGKNISVISDYKEKLLVVKAFGDKVIIAHNDKISQEKLNEMVPGMSLTFEEMRQQEEANKIALEETLNNPDSIDPVSGLTLGEVRRQEEMNKAALDEALSNPETTVPHTGDLSMEQLREIEENNRKELAERLNNPDTVDPVTGLKLSDLRRVEAENKRLLEEALNNPDTIDPMTGLTLRELQAQENK